MNHAPLAFLPLLCSAALAVAGPVTKLPPPPKAEWVVIPADPVQTTLSLDKPATWALLDATSHCDLRPSADGKTAVFAAVSPGQYRIVAAAEKEFHLIVVVVGDGPKPMPPGPDPKPPEPPKPPDPPKPADPLVKLLQVAYDDDDSLPAKDKRAVLEDMIELFGQVEILADDPLVLTTGELLRRFKAAANKLRTDKLPALRTANRLELQAAFPDDVPLTAGVRAKAAAAFSRIKGCLEGVK